MAKSHSAANSRTSDRYELFIGDSVFCRIAAVSGHVRFAVCVDCRREVRNLFYRNQQDSGDGGHGFA
jgi:hypothetical protein